MNGMGLVHTNQPSQVFFFFLPPFHSLAHLRWLSRNITLLLWKPCEIEAHAVNTLKLYYAISAYLWAPNSTCWKCEDFDTQKSSITWHDSTAYSAPVFTKQAGSWCFMLKVSKMTNNGSVQFVITKLHTRQVRQNDLYLLLYYSWSVPLVRPTMWIESQYWYDLLKV